MKNTRSKLFIILAILSFWLLTSCGVNWHLSTVNHDPVYGTVYVNDDVEIDTLNYTQFKRKLRTDFSFRWDYANYMMNQPLSFYYRNYRGPLGNAHNLWWNSNQYWTDWAFNYPFTSFNSWYWDRWDPWPRWRWNSWWGYSGGWYANTWNNHWYQYGYSGWYGHDSMLWGTQWRRNNVNYAYINGPRGSRANLDTNSNIQNNINNRRNSNNNVNSRGPRISNTENGIIIRNGNNIRVIPNNNIRVYNNPNNVPNRVIKPRNNSNPNWNNNNNNVIRNNSRPRIPDTNTNWNSGRPPVINNSGNTSRPPVINRGSSNISRGSSSSGGSSRGGRGNN
jgi:hypothetical protein